MSGPPRQNKIHRTAPCRTASLKPVDLSSLARSVAKGLQQAEPDRRVEVVIEPGLDAEADAGLMLIVLENLFGNAWKFTGKKSSARIEFGKTPHGGELTFYIREHSEAQFTHGLSTNCIKRLYEFPGFDDKTQD